MNELLASSQSRAKQDVLQAQDALFEYMGKQIPGSQLSSSRKKKGIRPAAMSMVATLDNLVWDFERDAKTFIQGDLTQMVLHMTRNEDNIGDVRISLQDLRLHHCEEQAPFPYLLVILVIYLISNVLIVKLCLGDIPMVDSN